MKWASDCVSAAAAAAAAGGDEGGEVDALVDHCQAVEGQVAGAEYDGMPITNAKELAGRGEWNRNA